MAHAMMLTPRKPEIFTERFVIIYRDIMPLNEYLAVVNVFEAIPGVSLITLTGEILDWGAQIKKKTSSSQHLAKSLRPRFVELSSKYSGNYPEIFANVGLHYQFEGVFDEINKAVKYEEVFSAFLDLFNPSIVIFAHEAFAVERSLVRSAKRRRILTVGLIHGGFRSGNSYDTITGDGDILLCWNDIDYDGFIKSGIDKSRLKKIGCLRYEDKYDQYLCESKKNIFNTKNKAREHLGISPDKPLIVFITAEINTGFVSALACPGKHRDAIRNILEFVEASPDLQFLIKPHPSYDYVEMYRRLLDNRLPNLVLVEHRTFTLDEVLDAADICVMVNYCTTAGLESMLKRVPVIYFENAVYPIDECQDNLPPSSVIRVHTVAELGEKIGRLLDNPEFRTQILADAEKAIKEFLDINEESATQRLKCFIINALEAQVHEGEKGLRSTELMRDVLRSKDVQNNLYREYGNAIKQSSNELQMYVFAYLAGMNNYGVASVFRLFHALQPNVKDEPQSSWKHARWSLLPMYIAGNGSKPMTFARSISITLALIPYMFSPRKLTCAPGWYKMPAFKALKSVLGPCGVYYLLKLLVRTSLYLRTLLFDLYKAILMPFKGSS